MSRSDEGVVSIPTDGATTGDTLLWVGLLWTGCVLLFVALLGAIAILWVRLRAAGVAKPPTRRTGPDGEAPR